jgi:thiol:disulfide interchange protein
MKQNINHRLYAATLVRVACGLLGGLLLAAPGAIAQSAGDVFPNITSLGNSGSQNADEVVTWKASYEVAADGRGQVHVAANLATHWHIYSTTQPAGGPKRTQISIRGPEGVTLTGEFAPDREPAKSVSAVYNGLTVEEHQEMVVWSAPISAPAGFNQPVEITVRGLVCMAEDENGRCMPINETLIANQNNAGPTVAERALVTEDAAPRPELKPFRDDKYVVEWNAEMVPQILAPGQAGVLRFTATPDQGFHIYRVAIDDSESATNFVVTNKDGLLVGRPVANKEVISKTLLANIPPVNYYPDRVTFELPIKVPAETALGLKTIEGMIAYQACTDDSCHRPTGLRFTAQLHVGEGPQAAAPQDQVSDDDAAQQPAAVELIPAKSADVLTAAAATKWVDPITLGGGADPNDRRQDSDDEAAIMGSPSPPTASGQTSFAMMLGFAFLGGLILNVMPCVLPVVGLKVMGFVSQAGQDRQRVLMLNLVYVLGIMSVFAILAVVAGFSKFGWGQQFTFFEVKLGLTILMFALALSYLGVWEIPVPGMAGGKASMELQNREGLVGAFSKGVFATILSTPCSGPLLGYILGATLTYSPLQTVVIMLTVGLGMSSPYVVIGAQPRLVAWLPKPGPWMETMKQLMAFLFLGTVAYFFAQFSEAHKLPVFITLIAVWFGCWIIGQVPNWAALPKRVAAWSSGIAIASLISIAAFHYSKPNDQLAWKDYSEPTLVSLQNAGKTVLLDFGAKWCATCQFNYNTALNTEQTREVLQELDAVAMYADWTDQNDEIEQKLAELNSRSIPLLVIYPGGRPQEPIILRDLVSQQDVIDALRQAGASVNHAFGGSASPVSVASSQ